MVLLFSVKAIPHPMPSSIVNFSFGDNEIHLKIEVPVTEFQSAIKKNFQGNATKIETEYKSDIANYFLQHVKIKSQQGEIQPMRFDNLQVHNTAYGFGQYQEIVVNLTCQTTPQFNNRDFILDYDAVIHQVVTHFALIKINQDFENGITPEDSVVVSTIHLDIASNTIKPLTIKLEKGSTWKGFNKMVKLGLHHIYTGLDHLLFILLLILISPLLLINNNQWGNFSSWKFTIKRLLKIITAFTLGHCITLLIFSFFNLNGISKYIEICISLTIIATAVHCIKPYFYNKEVLITFIFGLIHGSAFGITLNEWGISKNQKLISLLGFNLGIELMQIIIVLFCIPLIYLSKYLIYNKIRVAVASVTIFISIFWTIERITGTPNIITEYINKII